MSPTALGLLYFTIDLELATLPRYAVKETRKNPTSAVFEYGPASCTVATSVIY